MKVKRMWKGEEGVGIKKNNREGEYGHMCEPVTMKAISLYN
jgi:hypothetical protein